MEVGADGFGGAWEKAEALSRVTEGGIAARTMSIYSVALFSALEGVRAAQFVDCNKLIIR